MKKGIRIGAIASVLLAGTFASSANNHLASMEAELSSLPATMAPPAHVFDYIGPKLEKVINLLEAKEGIKGRIIFMDFSSPNLRIERQTEQASPPYPDTIAARRLLEEVFEKLQETHQYPFLKSDLAFFYSTLPNTKIDSSNFARFGGESHFKYLQNKLSDTLSSDILNAGIRSRYAMARSGEGTRIITQERELSEKIKGIMGEYSSTLKKFYVSMAVTMVVALTGAASILTKPYTFFRR